MLIEEELWIRINRGVSSGERQTQKKPSERLCLMMLCHCVKPICTAMATCELKNMTPGLVMKNNDSWSCYLMKKRLLVLLVDEETTLGLVLVEDAVEGTSEKHVHDTRGKHSTRTFLLHLLKAFLTFLTASSMLSEMVSRLRLVGPG